MTSRKLSFLPLLLAFAVAGTLLYAGGLDASQGRVPDLHPAAMSAAVRDGQTALALRFAKLLAPASGNSSSTGNVAFSPVSIHVALSLVAAGARGATLDQLLAFLGAPSAPGLADFGRHIVHSVLGDRADSGGPRVLFSGGIWADASRGGLKKAFRDVAVQCYKTASRIVRFADKVCDQFVCSSFPILSYH
jgi:serpin B